MAERYGKVLAGTLWVKMDEDTEKGFKQGEVFVLPAPTNPTQERYLARLLASGDVVECDADGYTRGEPKPEAPVAPAVEKGKKGKKGAAAPLAVDE